MPKPTLKQRTQAEMSLGLDPVQIIRAEEVRTLREQVRDLQIEMSSRIANFNTLQAQFEELKKLQISHRRTERERDGFRALWTKACLAACGFGPETIGRKLRQSLIEAL